MLRNAEPASAVLRPPAASGSRSPVTVAIATTAILALSAVTFAHPSASRIHTWPLSVLTFALWLLPFGLIVAAWMRAPAWRLPPPLLLAGMGLLALGTVLSALLSPFANASLPRVWPTLGGVCLYLFLHDRWSQAVVGGNRPNLDGVARGLGLAAVAFTGISLVQWSGGSWPLPWGGRNGAPFGHSTYTAGALILLLPWLALQILRSGDIVRVAWLGAFAAGVAALISTSSRGGVLALGCMSLAGEAFAWRTGNWTPRQKFALVAVVFSLGAVTVITNPRLRELVMHQRWGETATESNAQRHAMLDAGLQLGAAHPLLGWGPGTVPLAYPKFRSQLDGGTENILQLHNTPAQLWATTGAVGLTAMVLVIAGAAAVMSRSRTPVGSTAAASLLGYGVVALTDHQLDLPAMNMVAVTSLALLTATDVSGPRVVRPSRSRRLLAGIVLAAIIAVPVVTTSRELHARRLYDSALAALGRNETTLFLQRLDEASTVTPHDPYFQHQAASWLLDRRGAAQNSAARESLTRDAVARLEASLATGVHLEFAHFNLGWLALELDRPIDALRHFDTAAHLVPDKGGVYFGLGLANQMAGRRDAAVRCFALEIVNDPRRFTAPAWELPALGELQSEVRAEVLRLYAELERQHAPARTHHVWTRWWFGETVWPVELEAFNAASARFLAALPSITQLNAIAPTDSSWSKVYAAWQIARQSAAPARPEAFLSAAGGDHAFAAALARRAHRYRDDFRQFLTAPTDDEPAYVRTLRHQRTGYGMLALHPEGPALSDLYIIQENRVLADFCTQLLPPKGWLPGRLLLALLPENR